MEFSINRFLLLIKRELILSGKKYLIGILGGLLVTILITLLGLFGGYLSAEQYSINVLIFFIIGGTIITNNIFKEWNKTETGYQIITLPATNLEKLTSSWFVSIVLYSIAGILAILLGGVILSIIGSFDVPIKGNLFRFDRLWIIFTIHLIIGSMFFLGGLSFKSNAFFKTILAYNGISFVMGLIIVLVGYLMFQGYMVKTNDNGAVFEYTMSHVFDNNLWLSHTVHWLFAGFLGVVSYFKLKEREL